MASHTSNPFGTDASSFSVYRSAFDKATGRIPLPRCCPSSIDRRRVRCVRSADAFSAVVDRRMSMESAG